jgi:hypothetical protein
LLYLNLHLYRRKGYLKTKRSTVKTKCAAPAFSGSLYAETRLRLSCFSNFVYSKNSIGADFARQNPQHSREKYFPR